MCEADRRAGRRRLRRAQPRAHHPAQPTGRGAGTRAPAASRKLRQGATSRPCSSRAGAPSAPARGGPAGLRGGRLDPPRRQAARASPRARSRGSARSQRASSSGRSTAGSPSAYARSIAQVSVVVATASTPTEVPSARTGPSGSHFSAAWWRGACPRGSTSDAHQAVSMRPRLRAEERRGAGGDAPPRSSSSQSAEGNAQHVRVVLPRGRSPSFTACPVATGRAAPAAADGMHPPGREVSSCQLAIDKDGARTTSSGNSEPVASRARSG